MTTSSGKCSGREASGLCLHENVISLSCLSCKGVSTNSLCVSDSEEATNSNTWMMIDSMIEYRL